MFWEVIKNVGQKHFLWRGIRYVVHGGKKKKGNVLLISLAHARVEILSTSKIIHFFYNLITTL